MRSLRVQMAATLVVSIVCVVGMATAATFLVVRGIGDDEISTRVTKQVLLAVPLFEKAQSGPMQLAPAPVGGQPLEDLSKILQKKMHEAGLDLPALVTRPAPDELPVASIKLASGWIGIPIPDHDPPLAAWFALCGWILLIALGTVGVALVFAHRITRHLTILERVAATIGADGTVPLLPENGPPEVRATARALNTMTMRLKTAAESRMRLVAAAGHDLRTPMTRMRLRAEFLDEDERQKWLSDLEELDGIADSAIQLVREEGQGEKNSLLRIDETLADICQDLASMESPVTLIKTEPVTISSAPLALTRALRNLIINAATHGGGAFVTVGLQGNNAVITIDDNGPGIPDHSISRVFEPFFRVDPARRKSVAGAGLGLAIAKEIVERNGGGLNIRNRSPNGLRQEVVFPAQQRR
jgi:signal transduction histidine kinase